MAGEEKSSYCYSDVASSSGGNLVVSQLHNFDPNPEIYNLTAGMEMIGFPSKTTDHFYQNEGLMMVSQDSSSTWTHHHHNHNRSLLVDDQSLRCVFPCDENERPSQGQGQGQGQAQGLSLSLNSSNPSTIGLQTFDLRQQQQEPDDLRFGPSSSRSVNVPHLIQENSFIRNSKYLGPAQELLNEFCNLGTKLQDDDTNKQKVHHQKTSDGQENENVIKKQSLLCSLDFLELQIRKTKLLQMLEEVDRRYKHYCDQMKAVVSSFEAVAGNGAALVYSSLASKAMSRHFRCLKDGIVTQIKATKKAMGEKDIGAAPGTMRGETPRLRLIDQTLRQQRALQQMSMMESHPWRPQRGLPERSVSILRAWLFEHFLHPYPSDVDKHILARQTGLSRSQVSNWFINARVRLWKPMVEEMYLEEVKETEAAMGAAFAENDDDDDDQNPCRNNDQKPSQDQLVRIDSDCLSSIVTNPDYSRKDHGGGSTSRKDKSVIQIHNPNFARFGDSMELDFSSYNPHSGAVSLTLGLHQHGPGGGLSLGFSPAAAAQNNASSLFYPRSDNMEDCQTASYSLLESETQNLPAYRNLMGAQLLHDLAG